MALILLSSVGDIGPIRLSLVLRHFRRSRRSGLPRGQRLGPRVTAKPSIRRWPQTSTPRSAQCRSARSPSQSCAMLSCMMEKRGALAALRKVRMWASLVFRYAIATGRADSDPAAPLRGTFKAHKARNFAAVTKAKEFGELVAHVRTY